MDPVAFENIFEITDGVPTLTFTPMIRVSGPGDHHEIHRGFAVDVAHLGQTLSDRRMTSMIE